MDLTYPDSDWSGLGARLLDSPRKPKAFQRLEQPTAQDVARAREILAVHKQGLRKPKRPNGRPRKHPDLLRAVLLRERGLSWDQIAKELGCHRNTLCLRRKEVTVKK